MAADDDAIDAKLFAYTSDGIGMILEAKVVQIRSCALVRLSVIFTIANCSHKQYLHNLDNLMQYT